MKEEDLNVDWGECCLARLHPDLGSNVRMPSDQASFPPIGDLPGWRDCVLLQFYSHLLLYSEPYLFMGRLGSDLTVGEFTTSSPGLLLSSFPYGWVWVFHGWAWVFQVWSLAHCNLFMYGLNLKIPAATLPRTFDLHLVYDLVALSCHVQRSIRPTMASSILLSCLSIRFQGHFDLGFHR